MTNADAVEQNARRKARLIRSFLVEVLGNGQVAAIDIQARARAAGLLGPDEEINHSNSFRRAKKELGVRSRRREFGGPWFWELPLACSTATDVLAGAIDGEGQSESASCAEASPDHFSPVQVPALQGFGTSKIHGTAAWKSCVAGLNSNRAPVGISLHRWRMFIDDCNRFLDSPQAESALQRGWDALALFGCHPTQPLSYLGAAGLLWAVNGGRVVELRRGWAVIEHVNGSRRNFDQKRSQISDIALPWR